MSKDDDAFSQDLDERQEQLENRLRQQIDTLATDFADLGPDLRWTLVRGLIHQAIHFAAEREDIEFCAIATYLGDMIGHAHELMHDNEPTQPPREKLVH
jgi:hypothetical protein